MPDGSGLLVDVALSTKKLERDADRIVQKMTRAGEKIDSAWINATRGIDGRLKKAASSATVFEREIAKTDRQVENLRKSIDPLYAATRRLEQQEQLLNRAFKQGQISAKVYESTLSLVRAEYDLAANSAVRFGNAAQTVNRGFAGSRGQIQNVAFQVGDFATQVGAGTAASVALGQQLPQLLGGFGALGAVLGAVVAIGVPLGASLLRTNEEAEEVADVMADLATAVSNYTTAAEDAQLPSSELAERYQDLAGAAKEAFENIEAIAGVRAARALDSAVDDLVAKFGDFDVAVGASFGDLGEEAVAFRDELFAIQDALNSTSDAAERNELFAQLEALSERRAVLDELTAAVAALGSQYDITTAQARLLVDAALDLSAAEDGERRVEAAQRLNDAMLEVFGSAENLEDEMFAVFEQTQQIIQSVAEIETAVDNAGFSAVALRDYVSDVASGLGVAIGQANGLADAMASAATSAFEAARALAAARSERIAAGPDGAVNDVREQFFNGTGIRQEDIVAQVTRPARAATSRRSSGGGGSGGGGSAGPEFDFEGLADRQVEALRRQIEAVGKSATELAGLRAEYELLDAAKKAGIDLDRLTADGSQTVREAITAQAQAVSELAQELENAQNQQQVFEAGIDQIASDLANATESWEDFGEAAVAALRRIALEFATAQIADGISGLLGRGTDRTSGTFLGSLLSFNGGGFTGSGPRSGGVDGQGGFPAILHPNETVIDHSKGQGGSGVVNVNINLEGANGNQEIMRLVESGVASGLARADKQLPAKIRSVSADMRRR